MMCSNGTYIKTVNILFTLLVSLSSTNKQRDCAKEHKSMENEGAFEN